MQNANVTFKDKDTGRKISIDLQYDEETSSLDYNVNLDEEYTAKSNLDFIGFLADMFLGELAVNAEDNIDNDTE
jgi:hypothetical protein